MLHRDGTPPSTLQRAVSERVAPQGHYATSYGMLVACDQARETRQPDNVESLAGAVRNALRDCGAATQPFPSRSNARTSQSMTFSFFDRLVYRVLIGALILWREVPMY
jgi:hypothetical protein